MDIVLSEKFKAHLAIVRELAERGPHFANEYMTECVFCWVDQVGEKPATIIANHEPSCLWRRARELYPKAAE